MMAPDSGLAWSPWFRIIARNFLSRFVAVPALDLSASALMKCSLRSMPIAAPNASIYKSVTDK